ncbi:MAG: cyclic nucleotide-binding domain-containing protein, partial [Gammaproteobacteria bacterium]|nr:cyclic nucleotide-binding domain-containing protein [Gammaproteobacteria bacterium]
RFEEISKKIIIEEVRAGKYLFRIGDRDNQTVYLLGGEVNLLDGKRKFSAVIKADSNKSHYPIAAAQPRALSARAVKKCVVARIDSSLLEAFLSWDQSNNTEAVAIGADENEDWMTRMLQSRAFEKIPPAKIQQLLLKMDTIQLKADDTVIKQGDAGDYFYTIKSGKCAVTYKDTPQADDQLLAELSEGDSFGEDALVSDIKRNATVSMLTDGELMRLAKQDFIDLLQKPLIRYVDFEKAAVMVDEGAVWIDVRTADEYDNGVLEDSVNIPLSSLRGKMSELVLNHLYIICCDTGVHSASAAFTLSHKGFDVYVLQGGLEAAPDSSPADPEIAAGIGGFEQQITALNDQKQQLESGLAGAHEQQASLEQQMAELKKLHEQDKQQHARDAEEHERSAAALEDEARQLEVSSGKQEEKLDE